MMTILCVDDEPNILSSLRRLFRGKGYEVLTAISGAQGLDLLEQQPVDLVISDMRMPEMDGARFLAQVRERWPNTVRLLLTGYSDVQSIQDAINCGEIYRYITKPWDDNDILLIVRHALERHQLELEKQRLEALTLQQNEELKSLNTGLEQKVEERTRQLKANFLTTIKILSSIAESRGTGQTGQTRQVADLARKMATQLKLDMNEVQDIFIAALLHDLGRIGFSDEMLRTPMTMLQGADLALFRKHPVSGAQLLMPLTDMAGVAAIVRHQMERFDGQGYPDRMAGFAIPIGSRILTLAIDYYNLQQGALVQRHLRPEEAKSLVMDGSGKRYDPAVVQAFRQVVDGGVRGAAESSDVELLSGELVPGMVLSRDVVSRDGLMLLASDHVLNDRMIQQLQDFEKKSGHRLPIWVQRSAAAAPR
ncbi:Response regulator c-di-GMP phosphodiesterase, RpfG family, contains REC and HD-GYP domains [Duganella sp. CF458]|uniref:HD domain-containing phosphohydrolase n=1 Tax=Duganella sp. CF458 TaxID=1884368 RepID=UPI0008E16A64|nr:HD domain-containing phosphohydrolase [Duganella sp. CF458]SFF83289.1 Response regulator c-di-GMP phosphodiesterase, RpfG family, contains REC and HD-GYP domains [Duganella sp. CF458]